MKYGVKPDSKLPASALTHFDSLQAAQENVKVELKNPDGFTYKLVIEYMEAFIVFQ